MKITREFSSRYMNDGLSGGEKNRREILHLAMLRHLLAVLDDIFFFKQKTAYEISVRDWSSDVCSSDLRVDVVRIWLHDAGTEYRLAAQAGLAEKPGLAQMQFAPGEGAVGWIMEHLTPLQLPDLQVDPRFRERAWAQAEGLLSFVGVPLMLDDVPIGVLLCWTRHRRDFTSDDVALAQALATSAAVGIRNARLHEETQLRLRHTETLVADGGGG